MKYEYMIVKENNQHADREVNNRLGLISSSGWELWDWKTNREYTVLLFRREVSGK